jgi:hypothetical protein
MWNNIFADLKNGLEYAHSAVAAHEGNIAFVALATNDSSGERINSALKCYAKKHSIARQEILKKGRA